MLAERGLREAVIEHRHAHLPRVLTDTAPEGPADGIEALFALYDRYTADCRPGLETAGPPAPGAPADLAALAHADYTARFSPCAGHPAPPLAWIGYPAEESRQGAPHAVAHLGGGWFPGENLFLTYRREHDPVLGTWSAVFEVVDSDCPASTRTVTDLDGLLDELADLRASYDAWCQDGTETAGPFDDTDPYAYCGPADLA